VSHDAAGTAAVSWLQVRIDLRDRNAAPFEAALLALGAISIEYRDGADQPILEPGPGETPLWQDLALLALLPADTDTDDIHGVVEAAARPAEPPGLAIDRLEDRDWLAEWQATLQPRRFGQKLWVCPHDHPRPAGGGATVWLDPGLAFGTGSHPTTALCLDWIAENFEHGSLLDYGCGSGILAIAAMALGAERVAAIDNDPQAVAACRANLSRNLPERNMLVGAPEALDPDSRFDYIVANILSDTLVKLAPRLSRLRRGGTQIALTGILPGQVESVCRAYTPWFAGLTVQERDGWALVTGYARSQG